jgi:hypothetical protein
VAPGDACALPAAVPHALFDASGACLGDPTATLCPAAPSDAVAAELERARAVVRVQTPGPAPPPPRAAPSLAGLTVRAWPPEDRLTPIHAWGAAPNRVVGIGDDLLLTQGPRGRRYVRFGGIDARPQALVPHREGFVLVADAALPWGADRSAFHWIGVAGDGRVLPPVPLDWRPETLAAGLHARDDAVWVYGTRAGVIGRSPALSACRRGAGCASVVLDPCPDFSRAESMHDFESDAEGRGVALTREAMLTGRLDADARPPWRCQGFADPIPWRGDERSEVLTRFVDAILRPEGVYLCAQVETGPCQPTRSVVMHAPDPADPAPEVVWAAPEGLDCEGLLPRPGRPDGVRVEVEHRLFDLAPGAAPTDVGSVRAAWGDAPGATEARALDETTILLSGPRERAHVVRGEGAPAQIHGAPDPDPPRWRSAVPGTGGFWLLSTAGALYRLEPGGAPRPVFELGEPGRALAADPAQGDVLVVGEDAYALLPGGDPRGAARGPLDGLEDPRLAASMGAAGFVVLGARLEAARVDATGLAPLPVTFDDPATREVESPPAPSSDACAPGRLPPWLDAAGAEGAAWATGPEGLLVRFTAAGGLRKAVPTLADLHGLAVARAERITVSGYGPTPGAPGGATSRHQVFGLDLGGGWAQPATERHGRFIETSGLLEIVFARPLALFPDEGDGGITPTLLPSGYLSRFGGDMGLPFRRVPFAPVDAALALDGSRILVLGRGGRLALGTP